MQSSSPPRRLGRLTETDWQLIKQEAYGFYLEVGTHRGASACAAAHSADSVVTLDIYDWGQKVWEVIFPELAKKISFRKQTSRDYAESLGTRAFPHIDVCFVDGSHEYDSVKIDCESLWPLVKVGGTVMFHDHNPNNPHTGVYAAVNHFLADKKYEAHPKVEGTSNLLVVVKTG